MHSLAYLECVKYLFYKKLIMFVNYSSGRKLIVGFIALCILKKYNDFPILHD